jgi:hypothetical protein
VCKELLLVSIGPINVMSIGSRVVMRQRLVWLCLPCMRSPFVVQSWYSWIIKQLAVGRYVGLLSQRSAAAILQLAALFVVPGATAAAAAAWGRGYHLLLVTMLLCLLSCMQWGISWLHGHLVVQSSMDLRSGHLICCAIGCASLLWCAGVHKTPSVLWGCGGSSCQ